MSELKDSIPKTPEGKRKLLLETALDVINKKLREDNCDYSQVEGLIADKISLFTEHMVYDDFFQAVGNNEMQLAEHLKSLMIGFSKNNEIIAKYCPNPTLADPSFTRSVG